MADLSTNYMGLNLKNPVIVSSSGLTDSVEKILELEEKGAAAVVVKSLFEEQIMMDLDSQRMNNMFNTYSEAENYIGFYTRKNALDSYTALIGNSKQKAGIPVIASINCYSDDQWIDFASVSQDAGADGLELNMFILPADQEMKGGDIESIYMKVAEKVTGSVNIPVALKIHHYFSGLSNFVTGLSGTGIKALVLFNRFYQPDVDLEKEKITSGNIFSMPEENAMVIRWLSILSGKVSCDLAASTGIHSGEAVVKNLLVGANAVQVASVIYREGPAVIPSMLRYVNEWLDSHGYKSVNEITGKLRQADSLKPLAYERAQFMRYFSDAR